MQPFLLIALRGGLNILPYELEPLPYTWQVVKLGALAACPMLIVAGLVFPLLLRAAAVRESGRRIGMLLAWNGLGGLVGAELGQAWLGPMFGLWGSMLVLAALYGLLFTADAVGWLHCRRPPSLRVRVSGIVITLGALAGCGWLAGMGCGSQYSRDEIAMVHRRALRPNSCAMFIDPANRCCLRICVPRTMPGNFLTLEVAAKLKSPAFANLQAQATGRTPASLRDDRPGRLAAMAHATEAALKAQRKAG